MLKNNNHKSLVRRIVLTVVAGSLVFWVLACGLAAYIMYDEYGEAFDGALQITAERLLPLALKDVKDNDEDVDLLIQTSPAKNGVHHRHRQYTTYQLLDRNGQVVMRSDHAPITAYGAPLKTGYAKTRQYRIYSLQSADGDYFIQVADELSERSEAAREALFALLIPALLIVPLSLVLIISMLRKELKPITALSATIAEKDSGNLAWIDDQDMPKEFVPIVQSVNSLMKRVKAALDAERSFASNSAHELRTPIAGALAHTQILRDEVPAKYHERIAQIEQALQRLRRLSEKLLQLARADANIGLTGTMIDLCPYLEAVLDDFFRSGIAQKRLVVQFHVAKLYRPFNGDAMGIILRNLVENALTYSPEQSVVTVDIGEKQIAVSNDCEAITPDKLGLFTTRFYRGDSLREGSGLGLSIVNALTRSMGLRVTYQSPLIGSERGFLAVLTL